MKRWTLVVLALCGILASTAMAAETIKIINEKAAFPEGPLWYDGKLFYVEYGAHCAKTWDGVENALFWKLEGCGPSAIVRLPGGDFLVTCYDSGSIARVSPDGKTIAEYKKDAAGQDFVGPNDFAADPDGGVYFSASGPWESDPIVGKVFYMDPEGKIREVANDLHYANGLALSGDGGTLYAAESEAGRIICFSVAPDGSLSDRRLFVRVGQVDPESGPYAYPDGIKLDSKGNLYIGQYSKGRIVVVSSEKKLLRTLTVPSPAAPNLTFSPDESVVYVMAVDDQSDAPYWGKVYAVPNR